MVAKMESLVLNQYCLRIREEISSGPVALDGSSLFSSFSVPLAVILVNKLI
jgi:hypothetical protein